METEQLIKILAEFADLSAGFVDVLKSELRAEKYKTHQILHAAGQMENRVFFIVSGFARNYYFDHHGNEHTVRFWETGDVFFSYEGYYGVPSYYYTEILEDSTVFTLSYSDLYAIDNKFPEVSIIIKKLLLRYQQEEYKRQNLIALSSKERYLLLRKSKPSLFKKVPIRMIASYLNLTRETLTRLMGKRS